MQNTRQEWYDEESRVSIVIVDATAAAQSLARSHLCGPAAAFCLSRALAAVSLIGAETSLDDETAILQMKCSGPLGGLNVECTSQGTLRGYTEKKILDDFDASGAFDLRKIEGEKQFQITRSVPGKILSQCIATTLEGYYTMSLQRNAKIFLDAQVSQEVEVGFARGVMVERLPDSPLAPDAKLAKGKPNLSASARNILSKLGYAKAQLKKETPLSFACRCSMERAKAILSALAEEEKASLPPVVDIACHMCGKIYSVPIG